MTNQETMQTDPKSLLTDANSASQTISFLHIAFIALCGYVLVVVFRANDMDLMIGKNIIMPVIGLEVSISGFFTIAPYLIVIVHFNLLLNMYFFSSKLYVLRKYIRKNLQYSYLMDQINIFPYSYYLIGKLSPLVFTLVGLLVSITFILLPMITLCSLQVKFLAYQDPAITWAQRIAVWLDVLLLSVLWPVIQDSRGEWGRYWLKLTSDHEQNRGIWLVVPLAIIGLMLILFGPSEGSFWLGVVLYLASPVSFGVMEGFKDSPSSRQLSIMVLALCAVLFIKVVAETFQAPVIGLSGFLVCGALALFWTSEGTQGETKGSSALLVTVLLGTFAPLALMADGEGIEALAGKLYLTGDTTWLCDRYLTEARHIELENQVIASKPLSAEARGHLRANDWPELRFTIEPVSLRGRSLRRAKLTKAVLPYADLKFTNLEGADLSRANLVEADLSYAEIQGANLYQSALRGALLEYAHLEGAMLQDANLFGAYLPGAYLRGAVLWNANLHAADLNRAELHGAALGKAELHGANFEKAWLIACDMQGTNLRAARVQEAIGGLLDLRDLKQASPGEEDVKRDEATLGDSVSNKERLERVRPWLRVSDSHKSGLHQCLIEEANKGCPVLDLKDPFVTETKTKRGFDDKQALTGKQAFDERLQATLVDLACSSPHVARGILKQVAEPDRAEVKPSDSREGLGAALRERLSTDPGCQGLIRLNREEKALLAKAQTIPRPMPPSHQYDAEQPPPPQPNKDQISKHSRSKRP
jgi:uncharacterized protein YjbI with pentapeptide repeats